ncbi:hypothetical protein Y032_0415g1052, partial [Ancylostoma ceylanicum]
MLDLQEQNVARGCPMMHVVFLAISVILLTLDAYSPCPPRCQCYEDPDGRSRSMHLICKWEELNTTNLDSLRRPDLVRTLTIRCSHFSKKKSIPPAGLFRGLRNLDRLEIDRCILESLPGALFSGLHQLYSLIIKNAKLPTIPDELFAHTPNLMTLDMTGNELRIEPYSLKSLGNLIHLDLSNNSINFLANTLISLTKLKVLTMDNNKLTNIDFRRLPEELTDLSLRHNFITTIHYVPQSARNLRRIDLSGNMLDFLSGSGSVNMLPPDLKQVDLSNNRIAFIQEGSLAHMEKLALLDLKGNQLTELKEGSVLGPKTRLRLFLEGNPFQCHCGLRWLLHAKEKTSPVVLDLPTLSCSLLLDENQRLNLTVADQLNQLICKYESNAENVVVCEKLRFDRLAELPESVTELRIDSADWKRWNIERLQNSLSSLKSLTQLQLSSTSITKVPSQLGHLSQLFLAGNPLSQLTSEDLKVLDLVKKVSLGGNSTRFTCYCDSPSPLQLWLREKKNREK